MSTESCISKQDGLNEDEMEALEREILEGDLALLDLEIAILELDHQALTEELAELERAETRALLEDAAEVYVSRAQGAFMKGKISNALESLSTAKKLLGIDPDSMPD